MATTINLTEQELAELRDYTQETDDTAAVHLAMTEYLRLARRLRLKALSGQVEMEENWQSPHRVRDDSIAFRSDDSEII